MASRQARRHHICSARNAWHGRRMNCWSDVVQQSLKPFSCTQFTVSSLLHCLPIRIAERGAFSVKSVNMGPSPPALFSPPASDLLPSDNIFHASFSSSPQSAGPVFFDNYAGSAFDARGALLSPKDSPNSDPSLNVQVNYVGSMTETVNSRARKMSQSSNDREMSSDVKPPPKDGSVDPEPDSRGVKRKFASDVVDYPRRRATIAVREDKGTGSYFSRCRASRTTCASCFVFRSFQLMTS